MTSVLPIREGRHRLSIAHLLAALVALFVIMPFVDRWHYGQLVESAFFTLALLAAVNAVGGQRQMLVAAAAVAAPALILRWLTHLWLQPQVVELGLLAAIVFVAFVIWRLFRFVIGAPTVNAEVLCAAISIYLLFAVAWAYLYTLLAHWNAQAFAYTQPGIVAMGSFTALYFSVQVLTTITFGDIMPASNISRMAVLIEAAVGVFYMAILIARLVGLYASQASPNDPPRPTS